MDTITHNPAKSPPPLAWGLVWLGVFLEHGLPVYLIPAVAVHRPIRLGLTAPYPNWHVPLLLSAVYASAMTWQGWYTQQE